MPKTFEEFKNDVRKQLEHLAILRKLGIGMGFDASEVDDFIAKEGAKQVEKFDKKSDVELILFMLNDIMENAPDDIKSELMPL